MLFLAVLGIRAPAEEPLDASTSILLVYFMPREGDVAGELHAYELFLEQRGEAAYKVGVTAAAVRMHARGAAARCGERIRDRQTRILAAGGIPLDVLCSVACLQGGMP